MTGSHGILSLPWESSELRLSTPPSLLSPDHHCPHFCFSQNVIELESDDMHLKFPLVFLWLDGSFLFIAEYYSTVWKYHSLGIQSPTEGHHLACFWVLAIMHKVAMDIRMQACTDTLTFQKRFLKNSWAGSLYLKKQHGQPNNYSTIQKSTLTPQKSPDFLELRKLSLGWYSQVFIRNTNE